MLYIITGALGEFDKDELSILLRRLSSVISLPGSKAKLFLVGRSSVVTDIRIWFPDFEEKFANGCEVQTDVEVYTRDTITLRQEKDHFPQELISRDPALAQEIIEPLIKGADDMYVPSP